MRPQKIGYFLELKDNYINLYYYKYHKIRCLKFKSFSTMINSFSFEKKRVYCYTNEFGYLKSYCEQKYPNSCELKGFKDKCIAFEVESIIFRDMKYYYGTDKLIDIGIILNKITNEKPRTWNAGYTSVIGKTLCSDLIKKEFIEMPACLLDKMIHYSSFGAIIYSRKNKEFSNAYCYDRKTAYPSILCGSVPCMFKRVDKWVPQKGKIHWGKITIKHMKAKDVNFLPIYRGKKYNSDNLLLSGKRIHMATEYSYYGYIEHELELLNYAYDYEDVEITYVWEVYFNYLPKETRKTIFNLFDFKEEKKNDPNYDGVKQLLNRLYGYFLTVVPTKNENEFKVRDKGIPYAVGTWVISKQRMEVLKLFKKIGKENIIASHTDSVIATINCDSIINEINSKTNIYKKMGHWIGDPPYQKMCYFSNVTAKYLDSKGQLKMKHGGISDIDLNEFLKNKTYNDINENTKIDITRKVYFKQTKDGFKKYLLKEKTILGGINNVK